MVIDTNKTFAFVKINLVETNTWTNKDLKDSCICNWNTVMICYKLPPLLENKFIADLLHVN